MAKFYLLSAIAAVILFQAEAGLIEADYGAPAYGAPVAAYGGPAVAIGHGGHGAFGHGGLGAFGHGGHAAYGAPVVHAAPVSIYSEPSVYHTPRVVESHSHEHKVLNHDLHETKVHHSEDVAHKVKETNEFQDVVHKNHLHRHHLNLHNVHQLNKILHTTHLHQLHRHNVHLKNVHQPVVHNYYQEKTRVIPYTEHKHRVVPHYQKDIKHHEYTEKRPAIVKDHGKIAVAHAAGPWEGAGGAAGYASGYGH